MLAGHFGDFLVADHHHLLAFGDFHHLDHLARAAAVHHHHVRAVAAGLVRHHLAILHDDLADDLFAGLAGLTILAVDLVGEHHQLGRNRSTGRSRRRHRGGRRDGCGRCRWGRWCGLGTRRGGDQAAGSEAGDGQQAKCTTKTAQLAILHHGKSFLQLALVVHGAGGDRGGDAGRFQHRPAIGGAGVTIAAGQHAGIAGEFLIGAEGAPGCMGNRVPPMRRQHHQPGQIGGKIQPIMVGSFVQQGHAALGRRVASEEIGRQQSAALDDAGRHRAGHMGRDDHVHAALTGEQFPAAHCLAHKAHVPRPLDGEEGHRPCRPQAEQQKRPIRQQAHV